MLLLILLLACNCCPFCFSCFLPPLFRCYFFVQSHMVHTTCVPRASIFTTYLCKCCLSLCKYGFQFFPASDFAAVAAAASASIAAASASACMCCHTLQAGTHSCFHCCCCYACAAAVWLFVAPLSAATTTSLLRRYPSLLCHGLPSHLLLLLLWLLMVLRLQLLLLLLLCICCLMVTLATSPILCC